jgi:hypothetical protein
MQNEVINNQQTVSHINLHVYNNSKQIYKIQVKT